MLRAVYNTLYHIMLCQTAFSQTFPTVSGRVQKNPGFLTKPNPVFLGFIGFWALLGFQSFLFEWAVGKLVGWFSSSAKLLFRSASALDYLKIHSFINYWLLEALNRKKSLIIITGMTNWNRIKFDAGFLAGFFTGFYLGSYLGVWTLVSNELLATW